MVKAKQKKAAIALIEQAIKLHGDTPFLIVTEKWRVSSSYKETTIGRYFAEHGYEHDYVPSFAFRIRPLLQAVLEEEYCDHHMLWAEIDRALEHWELGPVENVWTQRCTFDLAMLPLVSGYAFPFGENIGTKDEFKAWLVANEKAPFKEENYAALCGDCYQTVINNFDDIQAKWLTTHFCKTYNISESWVERFD